MGLGARLIVRIATVAMLSGASPLIGGCSFTPSFGIRSRDPAVDAAPRDAGVGHTEDAWNDWSWDADLRRDSGPIQPPVDWLPFVDQPPPPVSGGSLLALSDGLHVVAADADTDRLHVITLGTPLSWVTVQLEAGSEPGRLVEDGVGRVHVALRRAGAIATLEPGATSVTTRTVCGAPRGLAWRASDDTLVVACLEGLLVLLPAAGGPTTRVDAPADDLRDVVLVDDLILVSRFRSAEVLALNAAGEITARWQPQTVERTDGIPGDLPDAGIPDAGIPDAGIPDAGIPDAGIPDGEIPDGGAAPPALFAPHVAWRMIPAPGGAWLLHQRHRVTAIPETGGVIRYGAAAECLGGGIIEESVSFVDASAPSGELGPSPPLPVVLATDLAVRPEVTAGDPTLRPARPAELALASAGITLAEPGRFQSIFVGSLVSATRGDPCSGDTAPTRAIQRATSVTYTTRGELLVLEHAPSMLHWFAPTGLQSTMLDRGGRATGHDIFHGVTNSGAACASCHPEGGDDGHTWQFGDAAPVRTQTVRGHMLDTAPFHWEGNLDTFSALLIEVWSHRMSGARLPSVAEDALYSWLDAVDAPPRPRGDADAIARGRALFDSSDVGCIDCHSGPSHTDGETVDVGTGGSFQVPVLTGVAFHAPYLHSGCATTLRDRFTGDPACTGGDEHGRTSHLESSEIDDLVAYLGSL